MGSVGTGVCGVSVGIRSLIIDVSSVVIGEGGSGVGIGSCKICAMGCGIGVIVRVKGCGANGSYGVWLGCVVG